MISNPFVPLRAIALFVGLMLALSSPASLAQTGGQAQCPAMAKGDAKCAASPAVTGQNVGDPPVPAGPKPQATCPIMGGPIDKSVHVDAGGYRFYACCPGCLGAIKADPAKALETLKSRGEEAERLPAPAKADEKKPG